MKKRMQLYRAIAETTMVFGLLSWLYVVLIEITHPKWIYDPLTVWFPLRVDYFGEIGFVIFLISFFILRWKFKNK